MTDDNEEKVAFIEAWVRVKDGYIREIYLKGMDEPIRVDFVPFPVPSAIQKTSP